MKHDYEAMVREALNEPGKLSSAYKAFHHYSLGNVFLAYGQLGRAEPIATFMRWKELGRYVKKGSKAIMLLMPLTVKNGEADEDGRKTIFVAKRHWFPLSATEGAEYVPDIPNFDLTRAMEQLQIRVEPFEHFSGNTQGYALPEKRAIAINPVAYAPLRTQFHEMGHILLDHGATATHGDHIPRDVREIEAELTSYLVCSSLGRTEHLEHSRGYLKNWTGDDTLGKVRYAAVFSGADKILKAGQPERPADTQQPAPVQGVGMG